MYIELQNVVYNVRNIHRRLSWVEWSQAIFPNKMYWQLKRIFNLWLWVMFHSLESVCLTAGEVSTADCRLSWLI